MRAHDWYFHVMQTVSEIDCKDMHVETVLRGSEVVVRVFARRKDNDDPSSFPENQYGRYWIIEQGESDDRIVQTVWLAVLVFEEHELREQFKYKGVAIFAPKH